MTRKKKGYWVVYLQWADAVANAAWIGSVEECRTWADNAGFYIHECGFVIEENKDYILFAQRWHPEGVDDGEQFGSIHKIPTTWIRNRKKLMFVEDK